VASIIHHRRADGRQIRRHPQPTDRMNTFGRDPALNLLASCLSRTMCAPSRSTNSYSGSIAVTSTFSSALSIGGKRFVPYREDGLVAKLSSDASPLWSKAISGGEADYAVDVAMSEPMTTRVS
jgi:hypothetical protein